MVAVTAIFPSPCFWKWSMSLALRWDGSHSAAVNAGLQSGPGLLLVSGLGLCSKPINTIHVARHDYITSDNVYIFMTLSSIVG